MVTEIVVLGMVSEKVHSSADAYDVNNRGSTAMQPLKLKGQFHCVAWLKFSGN
jgi:hypothetical protein